MAEEAKARYDKVTFKVVDLVCLIFLLPFLVVLLIGQILGLDFDVCFEIMRLDVVCVFGRMIMQLMTRHMRRN